MLLFLSHASLSSGEERITRALRSAGAQHKWARLAAGRTLVVSPVARRLDTLSAPTFRALTARRQVLEPFWKPLPIPREAITWRSGQHQCSSCGSPYRQPREDCPGNPLPLRKCGICLVAIHCRAPCAAAGWSVHLVSSEPWKADGGLRKPHEDSETMTSLEALLTAIPKAPRLRDADRSPVHHDLSGDWQTWAWPASSAASVAAAGQTMIGVVAHVEPGIGQVTRP